MKQLNKTVLHKIIFNKIIPLSLFLLMSFTLESFGQKELGKLYPHIYVSIYINEVSVPNINNNVFISHHKLQ